MTVRRAVALLAVGALAGCGGGTPISHSHHSRTGSLHGTVTSGPTSPVCRTGTHCSEPASGLQLTFTQDGRVAAHPVVARDGSYSVSLPPGVYTVAVSPLRLGAIVPSTVHVSAGRRGTVDFQIDTGMR